MEDIIELREMWDYLCVSEVLLQVYGLKLQGIEKAKEKSNYDFAYTGHSNSCHEEFICEIKGIEKLYNLDENHIFVFNFKKYVRLKKIQKERNKHERLLLFYLSIPTQEYFIIDLDKIDLNDIDFTLLRLKKTEYSFNQKMVEEIMMKIPMKYVIKRSKYTLSEEMREIDYRIAQLRNKEPDIECF